MEMIKPLLVDIEGGITCVMYDLQKYREAQAVLALNFWNSFGAQFWKSFSKTRKEFAKGEYNSSHLVWLFASHDRRPHPTHSWHFSLGEAAGDRQLLLCDPLKRREEDEDIIGICVRVLPSCGLSEEALVSALGAMSEITGHLVREYQVCRMGSLNNFLKSLLWLDMQKKCFGLPEPPFAEPYPFDTRGFEYEVRGYGTLKNAGMVQRPPPVALTAK